MNPNHDTASPTILLVEEDDELRAFLADQLTADDYVVYETADHERALRLCATQLPDAALIDVNAGSGRSLAATVRSGATAAVDAGLPLILLGSSPGELDAVRAFEAGADDYVLKPLSYPELRARLRALLSRVDRFTRPSSTIAIGELRIDVAQLRVSVSGQVVPMASKSFALLRTLAAEPTRVFTKTELLRGVWGYGPAASTRTLDSHACRLRSALSIGDARFVINVWGVGYKLIDGPVAYRAPCAPAPAS